jgi:hypothetical protein
MSEQSNQAPGNGRAHKAGAFDIRTLIAMLIGTFGVILLLTGIFDDTDAGRVKTDDINVNLWTGLGMVVAAALLQAWAMLRPVVVPDDPDEIPDHDGGGRSGSPGH